MDPQDKGNLMELSGEEEDAPPTPTNQPTTPKVLFSPSGRAWETDLQQAPATLVGSPEEAMEQHKEADKYLANLLAKVHSLGKQLREQKEEQQESSDKQVRMVTDLTTELSQSRKEAKSVHDSLTRTNVSKNEAEKKLRSLKDEVVALEGQLKEARAEVNNQKTWVEQSESYRESCEGVAQGRGGGAENHPGK